jgi:hypothetical protein
MDVQERVLDGGKINRSQSHGTQVYERRDQGLLLLPLLPSIKLPPSMEKNHQFNSSPCLFLVVPKKTKIVVNALFAWFISHTFSANEQCFSLTTNQQTAFSHGISAERTGLCVCCFWHVSRVLCVAFGMLVFTIVFKSLLLVE